MLHRGWYGRLGLVDSTAQPRGIKRGCGTLAMFNIIFKIKSKLFFYISQKI